MKNILKKTMECLAILGISAALWQLSLIPVAETINNQAPLSPSQNLYYFIALSSVIFLINWYVTKQGYLNWKTFPLDAQVRKWLLFGILATFILHFLSVLISNLEGVSYMRGATSTENYYLVIDIMVSVLLTPFAEELVFRKILTTLVFPKNIKLSLFVIGILFAAIHLPVTVGDWVNQLGAATILSIIYYKTRRVEAAILIHIFMNLFITILFLWPLYS